MDIDIDIHKYLNHLYLCIICWKFYKRNANKIVFFTVIYKFIQIDCFVFNVSFLLMEIFFMYYIFRKPKKSNSELCIREHLTILRKI